MSTTQPLALLPALPFELLTYILARPANPSTVVICQPRAGFLESLIHTLPQSSSSSEGNGKTHESLRHPLLIPTLHQVATSRNINLVFVPSLSHLRAYLAVFPHRAVEPLLGQHEGKRALPLMVVYGLVGLHRDTSEWSAQGLGNTLAGLVEAGERSRTSIVVFEERVVGEEPDYFNGDEEITEEEAREANKRDLLSGWEEEMPMLNGGARRGKVGENEGGWNGRNVEVGRVLSRWFQFGKGDWEDL